MRGSRSPVLYRMDGLAYLGGPIAKPVLSGQGFQDLINDLIRLLWIVTDQRFRIWIKILEVT